MPYQSVDEVPDYVPKEKKKQWLEVFNSSYKSAKKDGKSDSEAEQQAFAEANAVAKPGTKKEGNEKMKKFKKFIPFVKIDETKRQVWGIVTAEVPDKDDEVCDYTKSKPYYKAVIDEFTKATDGANFFPLREMHQLSAVGKCIGFEFRDSEKEIFMGFEVVDDEAWKKVQKRVYTGFSQGGSIVGDLKPDPVFKGCMRYTADPSECSLVDNPCLGVAHFTMVKADGSIEIHKLKSVNDSKQQVAKTQADKEEKKKIFEAKVKAYVRKRARIWVNKNFKKVSSRPSFMKLDDNLGKLRKGMLEVSCFAELIDHLTYLFFMVCNEQMWEGDADSELPEDLQKNLNDLIDTLLKMISEETDELKEDVTARLAATEAATEATQAAG